MWRLRAIGGWIRWIAGFFIRAFWGWSKGVYAVLFDDQGRILFVKNPDYWGFVGGLVLSGKPRSSFFEALVEKARKEVGLELLDYDPRPLRDLPSEVFTRDDAVFYFITEWEGVPSSRVLRVRGVRFFWEEELSELHLTPRVEEVAKAAFAELARKRLLLRLEELINPL